MGANQHAICEMWKYLAMIQWQNDVFWFVLYSFLNISLQSICYLSLNENFPGVINSAHVWVVIAHFVTQHIHNSIYTVGVIFSSSIDLWTIWSLWTGHLPFLLHSPTIWQKFSTNMQVSFRYFLTLDNYQKIVLPRSFRSVLNTRGPNTDSGDFHWFLPFVSYLLTN